MFLSLSLCLSLPRLKAGITEQYMYAEKPMHRCCHDCGIEAYTDMLLSFKVLSRIREKDTCIGFTNIVQEQLIQICMSLSLALSPTICSD